MIGAHSSAGEKHRQNILTDGGWLRRDEVLFEAHSAPACNGEQIIDTLKQQFNHFLLSLEIEDQSGRSRYGEIAALRESSPGAFLRAFARLAGNLNFVFPDLAVEAWAVNTQDRRRRLFIALRAFECLFDDQFLDLFERHIRKSASKVSVEPTGRKRRSSNTRSNFGCNSIGISPISSSIRLPPFAWAISPWRF